MASFVPRPIRLKSGETITLRNSHPDDALAFLAYAKRIMGEGFHSVTEPEEFNISEAQERAWIQGLLDNPSALMVVAEHQGQIIGEINFQALAQRRLQHTGNLAMSVHHAWRRKGIGLLLLQTLLDWASAHPHLEKVSLSVVATNDKAINLYRKLGFQMEGNRPREVKFGPGHYADVYLMYAFVKPTSP